jgi:acetylornithine deacetylase/succinyl-diaminopimelate desuccinylase-like protein
MMAVEPVELAQQLIRFNTTNPPGNERACIDYLNTLLIEAGCETVIVASDPERPNLVARIPGSGAAPPLLMYGHVDVVTTEQQNWTHPPFSGEIVDGYLWGRGALDMKGGVAMMVSAFLRMKMSGEQPHGDIILAVVSDEEAGGNYGARYLVEQHAELFAGVRYAIGEFGGFTFRIGGRTFYPIQVAEKQSCRLRATVRGAGGHGSLVTHGNAMAKLGRLLQRLDATRLPVHVIPIVREMVSTMGKSLSFPTGSILKKLATPVLTDRILNFLGERGAVFDPLLHNTIVPTIVRGGEKINVVPSEITIDFDTRLLPGFGPEDLIAEVRGVVGDDVELSVTDFLAGPANVDSGLFELLSGILRESDPDAIPIPYLLAAATDARHFARLNIQTYGFLPMPLPDDLNFSRLIHAADERVPVSAIEFGAEAVGKVLQRYGARG